MEDDKKKRKNNKKKIKKQQQQQSKSKADDSSSNTGETSSQDQNHGGNGDQHNDSNYAAEDGNSSSNVADSEKHQWLQEEARLRETVKQLLHEKDLYIQRQADMESIIKQLQCEKDSWREKEVGLEQRIDLVVQEKANLSLEEGHLREKIRHIEKEKFLLVEEENSRREQNATLNNENSNLRMQVFELEGAKLSLTQENKHLLDNISVLESRIQDLERSLTSALSPADGQEDACEKEESNAQIEAACTLIEKLVTENADLVEKMNELYMELNRLSVVPDATSVTMPDNTGPYPVAGSGEDTSLSRNAKQVETVSVVDQQAVSNGLNSDYTNAGQHSSENTVSGEIVQISLDENEAQDLEAQASPSEEEGVPITDAPLIGAPFRLVSFVTKYVSGADLVNKGSSNS